MKSSPAFRIDLNDRETVSAYDELPLWSAMFGLLLLKHLPLRRHAAVLDVGCGTGFPLLDLAGRMGSTCRIHGIDPWATALQRAMRKARVRQLLLEMGLTKAIAALQAHIRHRATVEGLTALFERAGFRLSKVRQETASMRFLDGSALLDHYFIRLGFLDGWKEVLRPEEQEEAFSLLESNLNTLSESRGGLALTIPMAYVEAVPTEDSRGSGTRVEVPAGAAKRLQEGAAEAIEKSGGLFSKASGAR
jgi:SAM-dependent methyltransferase